MTPEEFITLSKAVGWGVNRTWNMEEVQKALDQTTLTITARKEEHLIGCVRVLSDGLFFSTIPDIFVHPDHQGNGVGSQLMEEVKARLGHTSIFFGSQPGNEPFFEKLGFTKGIQSYQGRFK